MIKRATPVLGILALLVAAPAAAQEDRAVANLLVAGDFEADAISLRLPSVSPFPLVAGGWGVRSDETGATASIPAAAAGQRALEITSAAGETTFLIQDAPAGTAGFVFHASVQRDRGRQSIALFGPWDRMDPTAAALVRLDLRGRGLRVTTPAGTWSLGAPFEDGRWHDLQLTSDPRTDTIAIIVDDVLLASLPGAALTAPRTVVLGSGTEANRSAYRYDALALLRLPEIELAAIEDVASDAGLLRRLRGARLALEAGSERMFAAELRAARRALETADEGFRAEIGAALDALIDLVETR
jgi:hypothetical protein